MNRAMFCENDYLVIFSIIEGALMDEKKWKKLGEKSQRGKITIFKNKLLLSL